MNSLTENMATFAQILRQLGVRVSSAELVDAIGSLSLINMTDREQFKTALKSTLIKTADDYGAFDDAFRMFFVPPEAKEQSQVDWEDRRQENENRSQQAENELQFQGKPLELSEELKNVYSRLSEQDRQRLQSFLEKTSKGNNVKESFQPVAENIVKSALSYWQRQLSPEDLAQLANARRQLTGMDEIDRITEAAAGLGGSGSNSLLFKNMQEITEEEIPQVTVLIKRLAQRLNTHISRRYRTTGKHKTVDLRQSIRSNMKYGGMMLSLKHKTKKIHKPKVVVLCDVSASMAKYVRFTLPLLFGMARVVKHIESFIFADDLEEATNYFQRGQDFNQATEELLSGTAQMGQGTNLAIALNSLQKRYPHLLTPSTMVIIVSDAKTLSSLEAGAQLQDIGRMVKKILWLNTQPIERWTENSAIPIFQRFCDMVECYSLVHLLRILKKNFVSPT